MADIEVLVRIKCGHCEKGLIQNPVWKEYWDANHGIASKDTAMMWKWFEDRGLIEMSKPYMGQKVPLLPPEEIPCHECQGACIIEKWMPCTEIRIPPMTDCELEKCDYYTHYLRYGKADIPHHAFHKAMKECIEWQTVFREHLNKGKDIPKHVVEMCNKLEKEVRV